MLYVEDMRGVDAATWDGLLLRSPGGGHVLQTYAWGEFKATQGWKPLRRLITGVRRLRGVARDGQIMPAEEGDDARVGEARASILAARAAQAHDGRTPGRVAFTELGYVKSRWDMQFRTTMVIDLDRP